MYTIERLYDSIFLDESKNLSLKNCSSKLHWKVHHFRNWLYSTAHRRFDEKADFSVCLYLVFLVVMRESTAILQSLEKLAAVDGSAAWVASFGSSNYYLAALPIETQKIIYQDGPTRFLREVCSQYNPLLVLIMAGKCPEHGNFLVVQNGRLVRCRYL